MPNLPLDGRRLLLIGRFAALSRRELDRLIRLSGGKIAENPHPGVNLIVLGEGAPLGTDWLELSERLDRSTRTAFEQGKLETITETELLDRLDLSDSVSVQQEHPLYTGTMLAELCSVLPGTIRRWEELGLLVPVRKIGRLFYYDVEELLTADKIKRLTSAGFEPETILALTRRFESLYPESGRVLPRLILAGDGQTLLLKAGEWLCDLAGQRFFDWAVDTDLSSRSDNTVENRLKPEINTPFAENSPSDSLSDFLPDLLADSQLDPLPGPLSDSRSDTLPDALSDSPSSDRPFAAENRECRLSLKTALSPKPELTALDEMTIARYHRKIGERVVELCETASELTEHQQYADAVRCCRTALCLGGADAGISFQLAELLMLTGDWAAARERYFNVLEIEEDHLEARFGLGRALIKTGEREDALEVFRGALAIDPDYLDLRLELGLLLFRMGQNSEALEHLRFFREKDPKSTKIETVSEIIDQIQARLNAND